MCQLRTSIAHSIELLNNKEYVTMLVKKSIEYLIELLNNIEYVTMLVKIIYRVFNQIS
jgi:hypothetical protein